MQLPPQSVRTRILPLPCLWSVLSTGLEAVICPQPSESTGEPSSHASVQEECLWLTYRVFKYKAEWEEIVVFVSLNPGCYMVEGTACMFGVVVSVQRNDVNNPNHQLLSQNWRFLIVWKNRADQKTLELQKIGRKFGLNLWQSLKSWENTRRLMTRTW